MVGQILFVLTVAELNERAVPEGEPLELGVVGGDLLRDFEREPEQVRAFELGIGAAQEQHLEARCLQALDDRVPAEPVGLGAAGGSAKEDIRRLACVEAVLYRLGLVEDAFGPIGPLEADGEVGRVGLERFPREAE